MKNKYGLLLTLTVGCLLLLVLGSASAVDYWPMIVRGGPGVSTSYADGVLTVTISKARVGAGKSQNYGKLPVGSAAWVDRPLNADEPFYLKQKIDERGAHGIANWLQGSEAYWKFFCANTGAGYFEVLSSEKAFRTQGID